MSLDQNLDKILIIDFGSQFTQLIARRIRELRVFCEIISHKKIKNSIINEKIKGIILSGGPLNVYEINKYSFDEKILENNIPILGICFGHQILSKINGGRVKQSKHREFGLTKIYKRRSSLLIKNYFKREKFKKAWMSHADQVSKLIDQHLIEIAPLAFMRGRSLNESFLILDEAQNTTIEQMKMFLTRIGFGSRAVVTGDITQIDLPKGQRSGLKHCAKILRKIKKIAFTYFTAEDVVRHDLVKLIIEAYKSS